MSIFTGITDLVMVATTYTGYPPTGAQLPYVVNRPLLADQLEDNLLLDGNSLGWDFQYSLYCAAASVEASWNLAMAVVSDLQGKRLGGTTLSATIGYVGATVEGHYESQVTVQINQGGMA